MPTKRKPQPEANTIPTRFQPRFWEDADQRSMVVKAIRKRYDALCRDACVDSEQKDLIAQRVVFISIQLSSMEVEAAETGVFDKSVYTVMTNTLLGLLRSLGLEASKKQVTDLQSYLAEEDQDDD